MAYKVIKAHGSTHGKTRREFICDTAADITNLPTSNKMEKHRLVILFPMKCVLLVVLLLLQKLVICTN